MLWKGSRFTFLTLYSVLVLTTRQEIIQWIFAGPVIRSDLLSAPVSRLRYSSALTLCYRFLAFVCKVTSLVTIIVC